MKVCERVRPEERGILEERGRPGEGVALEAGVAEDVCGEYRLLSLGMCVLHASDRLLDGADPFLVEYVADHDDVSD